MFTDKQQAVLMKLNSDGNTCSFIDFINKDEMIVQYNGDFKIVVIK